MDNSLHNWFFFSNWCFGGTWKITKEVKINNLILSILKSRDGFPNLEEELISNLCKIILERVLEEALSNSIIT